MYKLAGNVGMFDWSYFDNSKLIMFDDWKVLFLRKKSLRRESEREPKVESQTKH